MKVLKFLLILVVMVALGYGLFYLDKHSSQTPELSVSPNPSSVAVNIIHVTPSPQPSVVTSSPAKTFLQKMITNLDIEAPITISARQVTIKPGKTLMLRGYDVQGSSPRTYMYYVGEKFSADDFNSFDGATYSASAFRNSSIICIDYFQNDTSGTFCADLPQ